MLIQEMAPTVAVLQRHNCSALLPTRLQRAHVLPITLPLVQVSQTKDLVHHLQASPLRALPPPPSIPSCRHTILNFRSTSRARNWFKGRLRSSIFLRNGSRRSHTRTVPPLLHLPVKHSKRTTRPANLRHDHINLQNLEANPQPPNRASPHHPTRRARNRYHRSRRSLRHF